MNDDKCMLLWDSIFMASVSTGVVKFKMWFFSEKCLKLHFLIKIFIKVSNTFQTTERMGRYFFFMNQFIAVMT
jgi:hypothetical protein